jgi:hypothetical protein
VACPLGCEEHPALIVAIDGNLVGVQRIFLTSDGHKARIEKPKRTLGPIQGNAVRLADWRITDTLALTEGLEDALAYHLLSGTPTWAALGAGRLAEMVLPLAIRR